MRQQRADASGGDGEHHHRLLREGHGIRSLIPPLIGRRSDKPPAGRYRRLMKRLFRHPERTSYGQRWQAETIFSMIKRNLGHALHAPRTRSYRSQCRELLLLALTHNVMLLWLRERFSTEQVGSHFRASLCLRGLPCGRRVTATPGGDGSVLA